MFSDVARSGGAATGDTFATTWMHNGFVCIVPQNLLFPTCIYHQIDKGFTPYELPHAEVFRLDSEEVYKANLDWDALRDCGAGGANAHVVVESVELPTIEPTCSACTI